MNPNMRNEKLRGVFLVSRMFRPSGRIEIADLQRACVLDTVGMSSIAI
jgi:hypothetical protein